MDIENCVDYRTFILQFSICLTAIKGAIIHAVIHNKLKLRRVSAYVFVGNKASAGLLEKLGFKKEGLMR